VANANSIANLKPWKPGQSGNPSGTNQWTYRAEVEQLFSEALSVTGEDGRTRAQAIVERLLEDAMAGKPCAMKLALDRILPVVKSVEVEVPGSDPAEFSAALDRFCTRDRIQGIGEILQEIGVIDPASPDGSPRATGDGEAEN
jgi:hypothetical protein